MTKNELLAQAEALEDFARVHRAHIPGDTDARWIEASEWACRSAESRAEQLRRAQAAAQEPVASPAYDWMEEARQIAAQCWCDPETQHKEMDATLAEAVARRIASWMRTGAQHARNEEYWRNRALAAEHTTAATPEPVAWLIEGAGINGPYALTVAEFTNRSFNTGKFTPLYTYPPGHTTADAPNREAGNLQALKAATEPSAVGVPDVAELVDTLESFAKAYPEDVFLPLTPEQTEAHSMIVTQASAGMGRHFGKFARRAAAALTSQATSIDFLKHKVAVGADLIRIDRERIAELESELTKTNVAFAEAVHMHQQERAAMSLLLERAEAERDALKLMCEELAVCAEVWIQCSGNTAKIMAISNMKEALAKYEEMKKGGV